MHLEQHMHTRSQLQHFTMFTLSSYVEEHIDLADNFDEWRQLITLIMLAGCLYMRHNVARRVSF